MPSGDPGTGQVLSIGELLVDFIVADGATSLEKAGTFVARAGGAPANVAVALARLGVRSAFCGVVGADPFGERLHQELVEEGVDTSRLRRTDLAATTMAYGWKDSRGDGHFWLLRAADTFLSPSDADAASVDGLAAIVIGSVSLAVETSRSAISRAVELAAMARVPIVFDVNLRPSTWSNPLDASRLSMQIASKCNVVKLSLDDAFGLLGPEVTPSSALAQLLDWGPQTVVLTDGDRGCWFSSSFDRNVRYVPAFSVHAIEPTGAGDAFLAALIDRMLASDWASPTRADIQFASAGGALATMKPGAWDGLPDRNQLETFLRMA